MYIYTVFRESKHPFLNVIINDLRSLRRIFDVGALKGIVQFKFEPCCCLFYFLFIQIFIETVFIRIDRLHSIFYLLQSILITLYSYIQESLEKTAAVGQLIYGTLIRSAMDNAFCISTLMFSENIF